MGANADAHVGGWGTPWDGAAMDAYAKRAGKPYQADFANWYDSRARQIYGQELPAADSVYQGALSGDTSQARYAQNAGLGQAREQMAQAMSPTAARAAMFGAGNASAGVLGQATQARDAEVGNGYGAMLGAHLRQIGYQNALNQFHSNLLQQRQQAYRGQAISSASIAAANRQMMQGLIGGGIAAGAGAATAGAMAAGGGEDYSPEANAQWNANAPGA